MSNCLLRYQRVRGDGTKVCGTCLLVKELRQKQSKWNTVLSNGGNCPKSTGGWRQNWHEDRSVWVQGATAAGFGVDIHGLCYHRGPFECPWTILLPKAMVRSVDHVATGGHTDLSGHASVRACAAFDDQVEDHSPTAANICVDVCSSCYHPRPSGCLWSML